MSFTKKFQQNECTNVLIMLKLVSSHYYINYNWFSILSIYKKHSGIYKTKQFTVLIDQTTNQETLRIAWFCRNHISLYPFSSFRNQESKLNTAISSNYIATQLYCN